MSENLSIRFPILPKTNIYTIFSKSGCINCIKSKKLLEEKEYINKYEVIDCDDYLVEDREGFLNYIKDLTGKNVTTFPMIFIGNKFLGAHDNLVHYLAMIDVFEPDYTV